MAIDKVLGVIRRDEPGLLQAMLDTFKGDTPGSPAGGILRLGRGDYYGNLAVNNDCTTIEGEGDGTVIHGSISSKYNSLTLKRLTVRGEGQPFAVKLYNPGSYQTRCLFENCWIGPSFEGDTTGPARTGGIGGHGLWLDGAILCDFVKCSIVFNPGSNVFMDTTDTAGTNVNRFQGCTMNGAGRYGVEVLGGSVGTVQIYGGNIESNNLGAIFATGCNGLEMIGIDFENNKVAVTDLVNVGSCNPVILERCNFLTVVPTARAFNFSSCGGVFVGRNRFAGFAGGAIGILDPNTAGIIEPTNVLADGADRFLEHRGRLVVLA